QRHERRQHYQGTGQHRHKDFTGGYYRGLSYRHFAIRKHAVCVLHNHNGIVDNNTERQQEREQGHHVQREVQGREDQERYEAGYRHGQCHKHSVGRTHEEHENYRHEDEPDDDRIDQVMQREPGVVRLVIGDRDIQPRRKYMRFELIDDLVDLVRRIDEVFSAPFDHVKRDHILFIQPGKAFLLFKRVYHFSDVFQVNLPTHNRTDHCIGDLVGVGVFTVYAERTLHAIHRELTTGNDYVLR